MKDATNIFGVGASPEAAAVHLIPVPFDATTSYRPGAADGPRAILQASTQVDLHDVETGDPWKRGIHLEPEDPDVRAWSRAAREHVEAVVDGLERGEPTPADRIALVNALGERLNDWVRGRTEAILDAGGLVGVLGGDHSVAFGAIAAHGARIEDLGILHVDAHADLRRAYQGFTWSHASIMDNVLERVPSITRLVQVGVRDLCEEERDRIAAAEERVSTWFDADLARRRFAGDTWATLAARIVEDLPRLVYVSFDIDGLDPALCPHTGTPVPGGLGFHEASYLLGEVVRSGRRIVGFDLVEVAPGPDGDEWDGNVGARLLYKLLGWCLASNPSA